MKSVIYTIIVFGCAYILIEPKDEYQAPELPQVQLQVNENLTTPKPQKIDTLITNIEKNLNYLKHTKLTEN